MDDGDHQLLPARVSKLSMHRKWCGWENVIASKRSVGGGQAGPVYKSHRFLNTIRRRQSPQVQVVRLAVWSGSSQGASSWSKKVAAGVPCMFPTLHGRPSITTSAAWAKAGLWDLAIQQMRWRAGKELGMLDATHIKVHRDGANPAGDQQKQAMSRTKGEARHPTACRRGWTQPTPSTDPDSRHRG